MEPCIKGQWKFAPVHEILPDNLNKAFVEGMEQFGKIIPGFSDGNVLTLTGFYVNPDETVQRKGSISGSIAEAEALGMKLARKLKEGECQ